MTTLYIFQWTFLFPIVRRCFSRKGRSKVVKLEVFSTTRERVQWLMVLAASATIPRGDV